MSGGAGRNAGNALTIVVPVQDGKAVALSAFLRDIGTHVANNTFIPFAALGSVHFLRWVVVPPATSADPALLAFECNHDGTADELLRELLANAAAGVHAIYAHTKGYPVSGASIGAGDADVVVRFLLAHAIPYRAFYVGVPGASVGQIRGESAIRNAIERYLGARAGNGAPDPKAICAGALELVRADPALSRVLDAADDTASIDPLRLAAGAAGAVAVSPALLLGLLAVFVKERFDTQTSQLAIPDEAASLMAREDLQIQNQLTHVVPLRPGLVRAATARVVLGAIDFLAHHFFTRGNLGGITSIHFARWVLVDEGRRLLFFSNYDGSWESYLGDFVDKAAIGLTSVWSNTEGFPKSLFLAFKGATDEERFKAWTRAHQVETQLWYSAYPDLTVRNILRNRTICAELRRGLRTNEERRRWLRHF